MKFACLVHFIEDPDAVSAIRPAHRQYLRQLIDRGQLVGTGPFQDRTGALFIYDADTPEDAQRFAAQDPYTLGGVIADQTIAAWDILYSSLGNFDLLS